MEEREQEKEILVKGKELVGLNYIFWLEDSMINRVCQGIIWNHRGIGF